MTDVSTTYTNHNIPAHTTTVKKVIDQGPVDARLIYSGSNYLSVNTSNTTITNTNAASASKWIVDTDGLTDGSMRLYIQIEETTTASDQYLNVVNGELTLSTAKTTSWQIANDGTFYNDGTRNWYLCYNNGWKVTRHSELYTLKDSSNNYINISNGKLVTSSTANTYWGLTDNNTKYCTTVDGTDYYIDISTGKLEGAMFITDKSGNHLSISGTTLENRTTQGNAAAWYLSGSSSTLYTLIGSTKYYLYNNNGTLTLSSTDSTTWTIDQTNNEIHNGEFYVYFNGTNWVLTRKTFTAISDGSGNYLVFKDSSFSNTTIPKAATEWAIDGNNRISTSIGNNIYYLRNNSGTLTYTTSTTNATTWTVQNDKIINGNYQLKYENGSWKLTECEYFLISDGRGNYLSTSGTSLTNATSESNAAHWYFSNTNNSVNISTRLDNTTYYLKRSNSTLSLTSNSNSSTSWTNNNGKLYNGGYYIRFTGTAWTLSTTSEPKTITGVRLKDSDEHYINGSTSSGAATVGDESNSTIWIKYNNYYYVANENGDRTNYRLVYYYYNSLVYITNSTYNYYYPYQMNNDGNLYAIYNNGYTYYIYYNNGRWSTTTTASNATIFTEEQVTMTATSTLNIQEVQVDATAKQETVSITPVTAFENITVSGITNVNTNFTHINCSPTTSHKFTVEMSEKPAGETYFPLAMVQNDDNTFDVREENTGYVISGGEDSSRGGDIRVSQYSKTDIKNSVNNTTEAGQLQADSIYTTINGDSSRVLKPNERAALKKFADSFEKLNKTLENTTDVYGLHFMDATISVDNYVVSPSASIEGETYTDYQLPKNCIDFNLSEQGYINFFAGAYFSGNNSFFSLHKIYRYKEGDTIPEGKKVNDLKEIRKISKVYQKTSDSSAPYAYKFDSASNGTLYAYYTVDQDGELVEERVSSLTGYTEVFDTAWIEQPNGVSKVDNRVYYYEIPANQGEYALGSVSGGTGAYLLYLDIGTGGAENVPEGDALLFADNRNEADFPANRESTQIQYEETVTEAKSVNVNTYPTYFPLAFNEQGDGVSELNTGYLVSGASFTKGSPLGDIRVSQYNKATGKNNISESLTNGILTDSLIYTINGSGTQTVSDYYTKNNFYKYNKSKSQMQGLLDGQDYVYGLHFMNAQIGMNNITTVPSASINGVPYTDYELPRDCIDFNVQSRGYVNFFAGTFFDGHDDSFFSLHKIERDSDGKITSIKEIKEIYKSSDSKKPYIYKFSDTDFESWEYYDNGNIKENLTYNDFSSLPSDYTSVFNTAWIGKQTEENKLHQNSVYYFEVPVDPGEYALGSVDGGTGAYLLYLDISANQGDSVVVREKMTITTDTYTLPKGVEFSGNPEKAFEIPITQTDDISFTVSGADVTTSPTLTQNYARSTKTIETVTVHDHLGSFVVQKITNGQDVSYLKGNTDETLTASTEAECSSYFNTENTNPVILTYHYMLEPGNAVNNSASHDIDSDYDSPSITEYKVTAAATSQDVTATVDMFDDSKNYLYFMDRRDYTTTSTKVPISAPTP